MGWSTSTTALMEQFDTLHIQCRHIEHMHEGVWFTKNNFWQNESCENLDIFSLIGILYMHRWCLHGPIESYHSFWWRNLILCWYNVDTLNICMKEFIIFVCTDSTEIFFSKLSSAGLNYNLPTFSLTLTVRGVSNKHCLFFFFIFIWPYLHCMHSYLLGLEVYLSEHSSSSYFVYTSSKGSAVTVFLSLCYSQGTKNFNIVLVLQDE